MSVDTVRSKLLTSPTIPDERRELLAQFIALLHAIYVDLHFTYLEINPLVVVHYTLPTVLPCPRCDLLTLPVSSCVDLCLGGQQCARA